MPVTRTLHLNTCRAVTPLPVVILVLKTALHLAPIRLIAQGDGLPFQIRCLMMPMIYTDQPRLKSMIPNIPHYEFIIIL